MLHNIPDPVLGVIVSKKFYGCGWRWTKIAFGLYHEFNASLSIAHIAVSILFRIYSSTLERCLNKMCLLSDQETGSGPLFKSTLTDEMAAMTLGWEIAGISCRNEEMEQQEEEAWGRGEQAGYLHKLAL